jgi:hypothetical protein
MRHPESRRRDFVGELQFRGAFLHPRLEFSTGADLFGDLNSEGHDAFDLSVEVAHGLVDEIEVDLFALVLQTAVEERPDVLAEEGNSGAVDLIEQCGETLIGEFRKRLDDGLADELAGGAAQNLT